MPRELFDGVTLTVEAALSASTGSYGTWGEARWAHGTWGPGLFWVDITKDFRSLTTESKFSRGLQEWQAGRATLELLNQEGNYSSSNLGGQHVSGGTSMIRPWRPVRARITYRGITEDLWNGYALDWIDQYDGAHPGGGAAYVSVPMTDEWGYLAKVKGYARTPVGAGETSGERIHRWLDLANYTGSRAVDVGKTTVQATDLSSGVIEGLQLTADSEGGAVWMDADGTIRFADRYAIIEDARSNTVQVIYGDGPGEMPYSGIQPRSSGDLLANMAAMSRVGGTVQTAADPTSRALYGDALPPDGVRSDLISETDAQVLGLAEMFVRGRKDIEERVEWIELNPRNNPARLYPDIMGRKIRDLVTVRRRPPGDFTVERDCHISGIAHTITTSTWKSKVSTCSASPWTIYATSRWGVGEWGSANWFFQ